MHRQPSAPATGVLTDLGYLLMGAWPPLHHLYRRWARRRYARLASAYGRRVRDDPGYLAPLQALLPRLSPSPQLIVEIGAGTGAASAVLARTFPGATVVAVDLSAEMLAQLHPGPVQLRAVVGDAVSVPLRSRIADLLVAHNAPFHMREMQRLASPAGSIAIVLSSAGRLPGPLRRALARTLTAPEWPCVEECRGGGGIALLMRRAAATGS